MTEKQNDDFHADLLRWFMVSLFAVLTCSCTLWIASLDTGTSQEVPRHLDQQEPF